MSKTPTSQSSFAGAKKRKLKTSWSVKAMDHVSRYVITAGGIGTIVAIILMFLFLLWEVAPLFTSAEFEQQLAFSVPWQNEQPLHVQVDEYQTTGWAIFPNGEMQVFRLDTGETLRTESLLAGELSEQSITTVSTSLVGDDCILGLSNGSLLVGQINFETRFIEEADLPAEYHDMKEGKSRLYADGMLQITPQGQFRLQTPRAEFKEPLRVGDSAVVLLDHKPFDTGGTKSLETSLVVYLESGEMKLITLAENAFLGGLEATEHGVPLESRSAKPLSALITERADNLYFAWDDGRIDRFDARKPSEVTRAEMVDLRPDTKAKLTLCDFLIGRETILTGDSEGNVSAWFRVRRDPSSATDGQELTLIHELSADTTSAVTSMSASRRSRMAAVGFADGSTRVYFVTTEAVIGTKSLEQQVPVERVLIAPKDDGLLALGGGKALGWEMDPAYPETTMGSLFGKVWYEGYDHPKWQWQSSAAGVGSEMKLSMVPLVFGTLKATLYTMLFATPLALLAAIYTSEFLAPAVKSTIKPTVESMASLPSVVLGFLAALVFAPYVEYVVPTVLAAFLTIPFVLTLSAFLWHLIPYKTVLLLRRYRFYFMLAAIVPGLVLAYLVGPWLEYLFFSGMVDSVRVGDMRAWLDGANLDGSTRTEKFGSGTGGWMLILLPLSALFVAFTLAPSLNSWLRDTASRWSRNQFASLNLLKFAIALLATVGLAYGCSFVLNYWGWDPRGSYLDTYQQRNALIVGMVMGFAVIPIIYTIADDALSAVPPHLRSASLGCGATPWQTAVRVVIPTAMSGLFSAVMVGLGRAVGETMIVLMAAGNTPILEMNLFSGLRTLSANIAVELPEAVQGDAHYRTLFLAALLLFLMTFVVNTAAELVRLRFRKRAYQL